LELLSARHSRIGDLAERGGGTMMTSEAQNAEPGLVRGLRLAAFIAVLAGAPTAFGLML
jgi:hypothetical protein